MLEAAIEAPRGKVRRSPREGELEGGDRGVEERRRRRAAASWVCDRNEGFQIFKAATWSRAIPQGPVAVWGGGLVDRARSYRANLAALANSLVCATIDDTAWILESGPGCVRVLG